MKVKDKYKVHHDAFERMEATNIATENPPPLHVLRPAKHLLPGIQGERHDIPPVIDG
jgi:hypothetical protein